MIWNIAYIKLEIKISKITLFTVLEIIPLCIGENEAIYAIKDNIRLSPANIEAKINVPSSKYIVELVLIVPFKILNFALVSIAKSNSDITLDKNEMTKNIVITNKSQKVTV